MPANPLTVEQAREELFVVVGEYARNDPEGPMAYLLHVEEAADAAMSAHQTREGE